MSALVAPVDPHQLRPLLHAEIDRMDDVNLAVLHRVALQLELEDVVARLDAGFDEDHADGKLSRLPEIIKEAREALKQRGAK
jgi:hypothetical protein